MTADVQTPEKITTCWVHIYSWKPVDDGNPLVVYARAVSITESRERADREVRQIEEDLRGAGNAEVTHVHVVTLRAGSAQLPYLEDEHAVAIFA